MLRSRASQETTQRPHDAQKDNGRVAGVVCRRWHPDDASGTPDDPMGWIIPRNEDDDDESGMWSVGASRCGDVEARTVAHHSLSA